MPDQNNPANPNDQSQSSSNQASQAQSQNQGVNQRSKEEVEEIQNIINQVSGKSQQTPANQAGQQQSQPQQQNQQGQQQQDNNQQPQKPSSPPKPVVEETSAPPPPSPPDQAGQDSPPPPPPSSGQSGSGGGDDSDDKKETLPPPPSSPSQEGSQEGQQPPGNIPPAMTTSKPKKKRSKKKIIATVLGLLLLVGGIGAGVVLVQQQQDIREQARVVGECESDADCGSGYKCVLKGGPGGITQCERISDPAPPPPDDDGDDGGGGGTNNSCPSFASVCVETEPGGCEKVSGSVSKSCGDFAGNCCVPSNKTNLSNGQECELNKQCQSGSCQFITGVPGGPYCVPAESEPAGSEGDACGANSDCQSGLVCEYSSNVGYPICQTSSTSDGDGETQQCTRVSRVTSDTNSTSITVTRAMENECTSSCPSGRLWVARYKCDGINLSGGCQDNGEVLSNNATPGETFSANEPSCGSVQVDVGCKNDAGTWGNVAFVSKSASQACSTSSGGNGGSTLSARCLNLQAYDTEGNQLTADDLSQLSAGDTVRFAVSGNTNSGSIDQARFIINGSQRPAVTQKLPGTNLFYDEYTIPEGQTSFSVNAQLHHTNPEIGWF